jgi:Fumarylacetoacetate (FAA) hydrolase family
MRYLKFLFLLISINSFCQSKIYIIGKVEDKESKKGIKAARIYNLNAKAGSTTNERGLFFIWAMPGDSVKITAKGYNSFSFLSEKITKDTTFSLVSDPTYVTTLDEVEVLGKKSEQMKREIAELLDEAPETGKFNAGDLLTTGTSAGTGGAGISINAIYDYFSKQGKDHRNAGYLAQQDRYQFYADWRMNRKLVTKLTGLTGTDLDQFMKTLTIDQSYILRATDYELNSTILSYFERFKNRNSYYVKPN